MEQARSPGRDPNASAEASDRSGPGSVRSAISNRAVARALAARGRRMPPDVGDEMRLALGVPVDDVRIHTDADADRAARDVGARAFTVGTDVYFRQGAFAPDQPSGRETLAHELTHTAQRPADGVLPAVSAPEDPAEIEAEAAGRAVATGPAPPATALAAPRAVAGAVIHRQPPPDQPGVMMQGGKPVFPPDIVADPGPRERIREMMKGGDVSDVFHKIDEVMMRGDYKDATYEERLWMIKVVGAVQSWPYRPAPGDAAIADPVVIVATLWESFGSDLMDVAGENFDLFKAFYKRGIVRGLEPVKKIEAAWESDIKTLARSYLGKNSMLVTDELQQLGEVQAAPDVPQQASDAAPERELHIAELQAAAKKIVEAQKALALMRAIPVGYTERVSEDLGRGTYGTMRLVEVFDPVHPPEVPYAGQATGHWSPGGGGNTVHYIDVMPGWNPYPDADPTGNESFSILGYDGVKQAHDALSEIVAQFMSQYPAIYAVAQADKLDELAKATPAEARALVIPTLRAVLENIRKTYPKLEPGEDLWLKMKPIHDQLIKGMVAAPSGTKWSDPIPSMIGKTIVENFESAEFWKDLGLATLAAAAFVIAELATAGSATFFLAAGVGIGIGAYQAYEKWDEYYTLSHAAGSAASEETQLVYPGQAEAAFIGAILDTVFAFLNVVGPAAHWAKAARAGLVPGMVTAGAAAAEIGGLETLSRQVAARQMSRTEARSLVERSVAELGVGETARRTGLRPQELLSYVDEQSDVGKRIAAYAKAPEEAVGPAGAAGTRLRGEFKGVKTTKVVAPKTDDWPEGLVHSGLNESEANASYAKSIFEDPHREAGIWEDLDNGEHLVVQGSPDTVEAVGKKGTGWMTDSEFAGRRWHFKEHYHPTMGKGWEISRYPSPEDYEVLLHPYWGRQPPVEPPTGISSVIRWTDPKAGHKTMYTSFGYDPGHEMPFWVEFKDAKTGMIRRERIAATAKGPPDYRPWLDNEAKGLSLEIDWSQHAESVLERPTGAAAVKVAPAARAGEFVQALREFATLEPAQAEAVLSGAIEELGPAEALRLVNMDWKTLAGTLPKTSNAGKKLLAWRDSVLGVEIRGLMTEEQAVRTGTIGAFENDFDWNFLGANAVENRAKVVSYLSGRTGMSPEQMRKLLAADFFADPRRMTLYESLPAAMRDRVAARQASLESQLIWNTQLTEAKAAGDTAAEQQIRAQMKELGVPEATGGVKAMSPEDIRVAEADIDRLHGQFDRAMSQKDLATAERRAMDIADRQAQINAASGGAYVSYGGVRKFAIEREAQLAAKAGGEMLQPGWYTGVIDQMPHLSHAVDELGEAVSQGSMATAMRSIGKYGDRLTNMANLGLARSGLRSAELEELEWDFKLLYARSKIAADDASSLASTLAKDAEGTLAKVTDILTRLQANSTEVLQALQQQAKLAGVDILFEEVQLLTHIHVKFLKLKSATILHIQLILQALRAGKLPEGWAQ
jgi:hypothetical protein